MNATCRRCGRALKNPVAIQKGIGPVCEKKSGYEDAAKKINDHGGVLDPSPASCGKVILKRMNDGTALANIPHKYVKHSPTGFEWGYGGSGPADLARNILIQLTGSDYAYQDFKFRFIAAIPKEGGEISVESIMEWRRNNQQPIFEKATEFMRD